VLLGPAPPPDVLRAHVAALIAGYRIPPHTVAEPPLTGPPAAVAERLQSYAAAGARHIVLGLIADDWHQQCDLLAEAVNLT
jgi:hypothetical protein